MAALKQVKLTSLKRPSGIDPVTVMKERETRFVLLSHLCSPIFPPTIPSIAALFCLSVYCTYVYSYSNIIYRIHSPMPAFSVITVVVMHMCL